MKDGSDVVMKIQYPGVADSIESDIENVRVLLTYTNLIPKGLFLDRAMKVNFFIHYVSRDMDGSHCFFSSYFCLWFGHAFALFILSVKILYSVQMDRIVM